MADQNPPTAAPIAANYWRNEKVRMVNSGAVVVILSVPAVSTISMAHPSFDFLTIKSPQENLRNARLTKHWCSLSLGNSKLAEYFTRGTADYFAGYCGHAGNYYAGRTRNNRLA